MPAVATSSTNIHRIGRMGISVVDYGVSNIASVLNMYAKLDIEASPVTSTAEIENAEKLLLPGVGSFDHGVSALLEQGLVEPIIERARSGIPLLGICLGMQLLGKGSAEGELDGLGLIDAYCERIPSVDESRIRVPHMGWNTISARREDQMLTDLPDSTRFYFVHSYHFVCANAADVLATSSHGVSFTSMTRRGNVIGAQFHPEKSHKYGMQILKNFAGLTA